MKILIGSIIVVFLILIGIWLILSPTFKLVGSKAQKIKRKLEEDDANGECDTNQKEK